MSAHDYFSYGEEVGCQVWGLITSMEQLGGEPVSLWLPPRFRPAGKMCIRDRVRTEQVGHGAQ